MNDQLLTYLQLLAGDEHPSRFLEIRYRLTEQLLGHAFYAIADLPRLARVIARKAASNDVYVGCAPRVRKSGGRDDVEHLWTLWVECDTETSAAALRAFEPRPTAVLRSGTGGNVHGYFALQTPVSADVAEDANRRLAAKLGADGRCYDAARILRPPGTSNYKHSPPRPVGVDWLEPERRLSIDAWLADVPQLPAPSRAPSRTVGRAPLGRRGGRGTGGDPLLKIAPDDYVCELLRVDEIPRDRKIRCPFHEERTPSFHVYPTAARGWHCFSCHRGGSIYDLGALIYGFRTRGPEFLQLRDALHERFAIPTLTRRRAAHA
ncbi:MAG: primase [Conexibacter sp.]|nr:primase [Conexibacter sp.]